jgi:hypothetical protein
MTDSQWKRALELCEAAWALPPDAARALIDSWREDPAIVHEVHQMLAAHREETDATITPTPAEASQASYAGITAGRYNVISLIGRGSSGDVYSRYDRELVATCISRR